MKYLLLSISLAISTITASVLGIYAEYQGGEVSRMDVFILSFVVFVAGELVFPTNAE